MDGLNGVDIFSSLFKSYVYDIYAKKAIFYILSLLKISPTGFIASILLKLGLYFFDKIYPEIIKIIKISEIKLENKIHQDAFEKELLKMKIIAASKGADSFEYKKQKEVTHEALVNLVVFNIQY